MRANLTALQQQLAASLPNENKSEGVDEAEKTWDEALNESAVTSSELRELKLTPRKKLLGDWFCEGDCGFIFAFRGVGKTWLAIAIAQRIAQGNGKLGDWEAHEPVKVLYIDAEMPADLMRDRSIGLETNDNFQIINHEILFDRTGKVLNIADPEIQNAITRRCVSTGVKVLFIDNLSSAAFGMKENEADSWEKVSPWLLDLRRRKVAVVLIHHAGRSGEMRGTTKREDAVFWIIALDDMKKNAEDKRGARFISRFTKPSRNTQDEVLAYEWHFVTEQTGTVTIAHKEAQSLDVLRKYIEDGVTECVQIAQEMKVSPATVSRLAKKAMDAGWLEKKRREYVIVDASKKASAATAESIPKEANGKAKQRRSRRKSGAGHKRQASPEEGQK
jgi:putative DNA primase/helicase